ncbi:hypothetical protein BCR32DRAFT_280131 [Anaeromyces robustus]|uniref:Periplasmic binding protein-like II n=1 Tax=Anaeromyces robustus TaxID=1754192 RepID=A0A1Y1X506_9FUNG|nr:hypothetical protein BCR32DRAFT_280131 [Anaeromyces robustus]|eukprot:ORX80889.1 hypothetical protein BCR32DRAFT_280131 [Anaeromyces robustus]
MAVYAFNYDSTFVELTNKFNDYAKENNLDIDLKMVLFTDQNTTAQKDNFFSSMDTLLNKKSQKYDLVVYDPLYIVEYEKHLLDLKEWLPQEHIQLYNSGNAPKISIHNNKWIGIPVFIKYKILLSNTILLNKYNKKAPRTWDELLETAEYIIQQEQEKYNRTIIGYNGSFPYNENSICSIYEYIYSFRKTKDSPFPGFNSDEAYEALNKLNEIKMKISSSDIFTSDIQYNVKLMLSNTLLFSNLWDVSFIPNYSMSILPGKIDGINGSCLGGLNIGIIKNFFLFSGLTSLYDDEEICSLIDCNFSKEIQGIQRPYNITNNYENYS